MFDDFLTRLSLRRATAGIYYELRTLRQMAEIYLQAMNLPLPADLRRMQKQKADPAIDQLAVGSPIDEETLAQQEADRIRRDILEGKDPGTDWRPDPNR